jgi:hypothetical protein
VVLSRVRSAALNGWGGVGEREVLLTMRGSASERQECDNAKVSQEMKEKGEGAE